MPNEIEELDEQIDALTYALEMLERKYRIEMITYRWSKDDETRHNEHQATLIVMKFKLLKKKKALQPTT